MAYSSQQNIIPETATKELCAFCSYKGLKTKAEFFCDRCDIGEDALLCQNCATSHGKRSQSKDHEVKPLSAFIRHARCKRHTGRVMKFFCMGCGTPVCEVCIAMEHDNHELVDTGTVLKTLNDKIEPLDQAYGCASAMQRELRGVRKVEEDTVTLIQNQAELLKKEIDKRRDVLVSEVRAKTGGKEMEKEVCRLVKRLQGSLKSGRDISAGGVTNAEQARNVFFTEATLTDARADASKKIAAFKRSMLDITVPRFIQREGVILGLIESYQWKKTAAVRLELGGKYMQKPCYEIGKAVTFLRQKGNAWCREIAFLENEKQGKITKSRLLMTGLSKQLQSVKEFDNAVDMIVQKDGKVVILCCTSECVALVGRRLQSTLFHTYIKTDLGGDVMIDTWKHQQIQNMNALALAAIKSELCILIKTDDFYEVAILSADLQSGKHPIEIMRRGQCTRECHKILCPYSDLFLLRDSSETVRACFLPKNAVPEHWGSVGGLCPLFPLKEIIWVENGRMKTIPLPPAEVKFKERAPIEPPVKDFHILDLCCDDERVYLCIKKGERSERTPEAGPIQFYEATYTNDEFEGEWQYTAIPLEDPRGKPFSELKKGEMLQLGVDNGTLMCLVYSPIHPDVSDERGMYITWYHGKLPYELVNEW